MWSDMDTRNEDDEGRGRQLTLGLQLQVLFVSGELLEDEARSGSEGSPNSGCCMWNIYSLFGWMLI